MKAVTSSPEQTVVPTVCRPADLLGDYPAVQYVPPEGTFSIDILTRLGTLDIKIDPGYRRLDDAGVDLTKQWSMPMDAKKRVLLATSVRSETC